MSGRTLLKTENGQTRAFRADLDVSRVWEVVRCGRPDGRRAGRRDLRCGCPAVRGPRQDPSTSLPKRHDRRCCSSSSKGDPARGHADTVPSRLRSRPPGRSRQVDLPPRAEPPADRARAAPTEPWRLPLDGCHGFRHAQRPYPPQRRSRIPPARATKLASGRSRGRPVASRGKWLRCRRLSIGAAVRRGPNPRGVSDLGPRFCLFFPRLCGGSAPSYGAMGDHDLRVETPLRPRIRGHLPPQRRGEEK